MDMNSTKDPAHITITYDANSSKSADIFVINDDGSISINCGLESEITFSGAKNNGSAGYTFEVTVAMVIINIISTAALPMSSSTTAIMILT